MDTFALITRQSWKTCGQTDGRGNKNTGGYLGGDGETDGPDGKYSNIKNGLTHILLLVHIHGRGFVRT